MKLLVDNNLSYKLVMPLQAYFQGTTHVRENPGVMAGDIQIWNYAKANGLSIITKDNDFDERSQLEGCPPKVIHLVCGNKSTSQILELLLFYKNEILSFGEKDSENCLLKIS